VSDDLDRIEQIIDASGVADIELLLPTGVRPRQLKITTLLIGMTLAMRAGRPALLTDVHTTLTALPESVQRRLGVIATWKHTEHRLTYRQVEYTFDRLTNALAKPTPPSLSTSGETLTIEELLTLRARTENAGHVGDEHEWSWSWSLG